MRRPKTHFEQVPLEIVRKIVKDQLQREIDSDDGIANEDLENATAWAEEAHTAEADNVVIRNYRNKL